MPTTRPPRKPPLSRPPANLVAHKFWTVPKLWPGSTVYILGGGPGLQLVDLEKLRPGRVIACNMAFRRAPWAEVVYFGDHHFPQDYAPDVRQFEGMRITSCPHHRKDRAFLTTGREYTHGISRHADAVCWNDSTGASAINLAVHFGAKRIILYGFDMRVWAEKEVREAFGIYNPQLKTNFHTDYHANAGRKNPYAAFLKPFPAIARALKDLGIECLNATPGSAITEFPIVDPARTYPPIEGEIPHLSTTSSNALLKPPTLPNISSAASCQSPSRWS